MSGFRAILRRLDVRTTRASPLVMLAIVMNQYVQRGLALHALSFPYVGILLVAER